MFDHAAVRALLPHGHPMVLVDRVESLDPGVSICAIKAISGSEPCYHDVAPGADCGAFAYPTSLLVESFGQAAALLWMGSSNVEFDGLDAVLMFAAARNCRIESRAFPGDVLRHVVRIDHTVEGTAFVEGSTSVGERRIASFSQMIAVARPRAGVAVTGLSSV